MFISDHFQDDGEYDKKHSQFVSNLSDRNLGDALAAIGRDHGPIVGKDSLS